MWEFSRCCLLLETRPPQTTGPSALRSTSSFLKHIYSCSTGEKEILLVKQGCLLRGLGHESLESSVPFLSRKLMTMDSTNGDMLQSSQKLYGGSICLFSPEDISVRSGSVHMTDQHTSEILSWWFHPMSHPKASNSKATNPTSLPQLQHAANKTIKKWGSFLNCNYVRSWIPSHPFHKFV